MDPIEAKRGAQVTALAAAIARMQLFICTSTCVCNICFGIPSCPSCVRPASHADPCACVCIYYAYTVAVVGVCLDVQSSESLILQGRKSVAMAPPVPKFKPAADGARADSATIEAPHKVKQLPQIDEAGEEADVVLVESTNTLGAKGAEVQMGNDAGKEVHEVGSAPGVQNSEELGGGPDVGLQGLTAASRKGQAATPNSSGGESFGSGHAIINGVCDLTLD